MSIFKGIRDGRVRGSYFAEFLRPKPTPRAPIIRDAEFTEPPRVGREIGIAMNITAQPHAEIAHEWRVDGDVVSDAATYTPSAEGVLIECLVWVRNLLGNEAVTVGPAEVLPAIETGVVTLVEYVEPPDEYGSSWGETVPLTEDGIELVEAI